MTETKHTPGPWRIVKGQIPNDDDGVYNYGIFTDIDWKHHVIAEAFGRSDETTFHDARANATLIAAAPDLYEALDAVMREFGPGTMSDAAFERATIALEKADGKTITARGEGE